MAAGNIIKSAVSSLTGKIEKAVIEITDERSQAKASAVQVSDVQPRAAIPAGLGTAAGKLGEAAKKAAEAADKVAGAVQMAGMNGLLEEVKKELPLDSVKKKRFEVKFNPGTISFQGMGGGQVAKTNFAAEGKVEMEYEPMKPRIQMNIQLVFDDYERTEAFMMEKFSDTTAAIRTVAGGIASAITGKTHSVQPQVEGFIGALRNNYTRKVTFYWGNMRYQGIMTHVGAEYTMFSTDGAPIRANVNLGMLLTDDSMEDNYMGQWQNSYQEVFGGKATNLGNALQGVGNLLNINL